MAFINLIRLRQLIKNVFIILPVFFAGLLSDSTALLPALKAFVYFSLISSGVYIFNDLCDLPYDQQHPTKKHRALAAGLIDPSTAKVLMLLLTTSGLMLLFFQSLTAFYWAVAYLAMNLLYSIKLKTIKILDVLIVAFGFVIRLIIGSIVSSIILTQWLIWMVMLCASLVALSKRRSDLVTPQYTKAKYNLKLVELLMLGCSLAIIGTYLVFISQADSTQDHNPLLLLLSAVIVATSIKRFLQVSKMTTLSPVTIFFKDPVILVSMIVWFGTFYWMIYL